MGEGSSPIMKRIRRTSVELASAEHDIVDPLLTPAITSLETENRVDTVDASHISDATGNHASRFSEKNTMPVGSSASQPISASASSVWPKVSPRAVAGGSKPAEELPSLPEALSSSSSDPVDQSSEIACSEDGTKASTSKLNQPFAAIEESLQCVICQEILHMCIRFVPLYRTVPLLVSICVIFAALFL